MNYHANVCTIANELHSPIAKILHLLHTVKTSKEIFVFSYHIKNRLRYIHRETHAPHYTAVINLFADENFSFSAHINTHTSFHLIAYLQQEPHLLLYSHIRVFHFSNNPYENPNSRRNTHNADDLKMYDMIRNVFRIWIRTCLRFALCFKLPEKWIFFSPYNILK